MKILKMFSLQNVCNYIRMYIHINYFAWNMFQGLGDFLGMIDSPVSYRFAYQGGPS